MGERVALGRNPAGLTQEALADAVGLDRSALAKVERGIRRVSALELARVARVLDLPLDWFLNESPPAIVNRRSESATLEAVSRLDGEVDGRRHGSLHRGKLLRLGGRQGVPISHGRCVSQSHFVEAVVALAAEPPSMEVYEAKRAAL
ncbi:MAG: helix-turn-helix domain-containing protein [Actinobacteria bacterium]|nr:helix-turn-helix domain-containing protein [Actinomycetota bacterium]